MRPRLSRIVDRARDIEPQLLASRGAEHDRLRGRTHVLDRRIAIVSWAIFFAVLSAVLICAVVVVLLSPTLHRFRRWERHRRPVHCLDYRDRAGFAAFLVETRIACSAARIRAELLQHQPE